MSEILKATAEWLWGPPLLSLLLGGGVLFALYSRFVPFLYLGHGVRVLLGKYDDERAPGEVSHFRALCSTLSGTVGMGNVAGVAIAVTQGGPGALFWMWVCALLGMTTKFFTCSLAVMYRGEDDAGQVQGGPMYFIVKGLGPRWRPLALMFCFCGMFGCLPLLQSNQLTEIVRTMFLEPNEWFVGSKQPVSAADEIDLVEGERRRGAQMVGECLGRTGGEEAGMRIADLRHLLLKQGIAADLAQHAREHLVRGAPVAVGLVQLAQELVTRMLPAESVPGRDEAKAITGANYSIDGGWTAE
mgnify:CR=1 FL=1